MARAFLFRCNHPARIRDGRKIVLRFAAVSVYS